MAAQRAGRRHRADAEARPGTARAGAEHQRRAAAEPHIHVGTRRCGTGQDRVRDQWAPGRGMDHGNCAGDRPASTRRRQRQLVYRERRPAVRLSHSRRKTRLGARPVRDYARIDPQQPPMAGERDAGAPKHQPDRAERRGRPKQDPGWHAAGGGRRKQRAIPADLGRRGQAIGGVRADPAGSRVLHRPEYAREGRDELRVPPHVHQWQRRIHPERRSQLQSVQVFQRHGDRDGPQSAVAPFPSSPPPGFRRCALSRLSQRCA
jgi:hypothetical protein